jgi:flagellar protein FliL
MAKKPAKTEADATTGDEGDKPKGKLAALMSGKTPLIIGGVVAVLLVGGGAGYFLLAKGKGETEVAAAVAPTTPGKPSTPAPAASGPKKPSAFLDLPEMTVNLAAGGAAQSDRQYFLKMKIALEVNEQKVVTEIQPMLPRVLDTFQVYMRELRPQDLEGSAGLYRLKEEMMRRVNVAVYPAKVDAVLFKELMVQ